MLEQAWRLFRHDIAIDLGSHRTRIFVQGQGLAFAEPTIVVTETQGSIETMLSFGQGAKQYEGRTPPKMTIHHPVKNSVISNMSLVEGFLKYALHKSGASGTLLKPKILLSVPSGISSAAKKNLLDILYTLGNRESVYVDTLLCSGLGSKLPINEPTGSLLLHMGHGTTQVGVLTLSGLAVSGTLNIAGAQLNQSLVEFLKTEKKVAVSPLMAAQIKDSIGQAYPTGDLRSMQVMGQDLLSGQFRQLDLSSTELIEGLHPPLYRIANFLRQTIRALSPELCADILESGVRLSGGTAQMPGIDDFFSEELRIPVFVAEHPDLTTILGAGSLLDNEDLLDWLGEERD